MRVVTFLGFDFLTGDSQDATKWLIDLLTVRGKGTRIVIHINVNNYFHLHKYLVESKAKDKGCHLIFDGIGMKLGYFLKNGRMISQEHIGESCSTIVFLKISLTEVADSLHDILNSIDGVTNITIDGTDASFNFEESRLSQHQLLKDLITRGLPIKSFAQDKIDLQHAYLGLTQT